MHSVNSLKVCDRLNAYRPDSLPPLNICLEVNVSEEPTKTGIFSEEVFALAEYCTTLPRLRLRGLMTIPIAFESLELQRKECRKLRYLFDELNKKNFKLDTLSMGMSTDLEAAIAEGSTMVRVGTAIFGAR